MTREDRLGAGPGGGLLFVLLLLFVAWLALRVVDGVLEVVVVVAVVVLVGAFAASVLRRR